MVKMVKIEEAEEVAEEEAEVAEEVEQVAVEVEQEAVEVEQEAESGLGSKLSCSCGPFHRQLPGFAASSLGLAACFCLGVRNKLASQL